MNIKPTVDTINDIAYALEKYASDVRRVAQRVEETGELGLASEAINAVTNCIMNLRLDLLVTRPCREYEKELARHEDRKA